MIDPANPIKYDCNPAEMQERWLFAVIVAGKTASVQAAKLEAFLTRIQGPTPFSKIRRAHYHGYLLKALQDARMGQYTRIHRVFVESLKLDLKTCALSDLLAIKGVGHKTARMFLMQTRAKQRFAALDTHILKFLKAQGIPCTLSTPSHPGQYAYLESEFLRLADEAEMDPVDFDLQIWNSYKRTIGSSVAKAA
jgi:hypothetical protein